MLRLMIFLLFLIGSVYFGIEVLQHPGYVLLVYQPWVIQMPTWFALLSFVMILGLFYLLITTVDEIQFLWFRLKNWLHARRQNQSYSKTQHGLSALIEGRWQKAENLLLANVKQTEEPLMNYLGAAKAAHEQEAFERRDHYLKKAYQVAPNADLAIGLTQAELELNQQHFEQAAATLEPLRQANPRHPRVLKFLEKVYVHLKDWHHLLLLLPSLRKANVLSSSQTDLFEKNLYGEILNATHDKSLKEIHDLWDETPRHMRKNPDVVYAYVKQLTRFPNTSKEIEDLICKILKYHWQPELLKIYGELPFTNLNKQLEVAGAWLKIYGQQPELLLLLGKLCVRIQLWGKAKDYFEKALVLKPNLQASLEYSKLLEDLGESNEALQAYKDGVARVLVENATHESKEC